MLTDPDIQLMLNFKEGDQRAFRLLFDKYKKQVINYCFRFCGHRGVAEDLAQEVFVTVFKRVGDFRGESKLSTWIYRIAMNLTKNRHKYLARRHHKSHSDIDGNEPSQLHNEAQGRTSGEVGRPDWDAMGNETERIVIASLHSLDPDFREILILRDVENLSYEEVGAITNLPAGTVKSRLHRARGLLKSKVEEMLSSPVP